MRCPAAGCGWNGSGKFCPECGTKTVEDLPDLVVICDGKTEDGSACRAEITAGQKFCMNCGKKVDQGLFASLGDVCAGCGYPQASSCVFCPECGLKKGRTPSSALSASQTDLQTIKSTTANTNEDVHDILSMVKELVQRHPNPASIALPGTPVDVNVKICAAEGERKVSQLLVDLLNAKAKNDPKLKDYLSNPEFEKILETVNELKENISSGNREITDAHAKCVIICIHCPNFESFEELVYQSFSGHINELFKPVEKAIRRMEGYEEVSLEAAIPDEVLWKHLHIIVENILAAYGYIQDSRPESGDPVDVIQGADILPPDGTDVGTHIRINVQPRSMDHYAHIVDTFKSGSMARTLEKLTHAVKEYYKLNYLCIEARLAEPMAHLIDEQLTEKKERNNDAVPIEAKNYSTKTEFAELKTHSTETNIAEQKTHTTEATLPERKNLNFEARTEVLNYPQSEQEEISKDVTVLTEPNDCKQQDSMEMSDPNTPAPEQFTEKDDEMEKPKAETSDLPVVHEPPVLDEPAMVNEPPMVNKPPMVQEPPVIHEPPTLPKFPQDLVDESNVGDVTEPIEDIDKIETELKLKAENPDESALPETNRKRPKGNLNIFVEDSASDTVHRLNREDDSSALHIENQDVNNSNSVANDGLSEKLASVSLNAKGNVKIFVEGSSDSSSEQGEQPEQSHTLGTQSVVSSADSGTPENDEAGTTTKKEKEHSENKSGEVINKTENQAASEDQGTEMHQEHSDGSSYGTAESGSESEETSFDSSIEEDQKNLVKKVAASKSTEGSAQKRKKTNNKNKKKIKFTENNKNATELSKQGASAGVSEESNLGSEQNGEKQLNVNVNKQDDEIVKDKSTDADVKANEDEMVSESPQKVFGAAKTWQAPKESNETSTSSGLFDTKTTVETEGKPKEKVMTEEMTDKNDKEKLEEAKENDSDNTDGSDQEMTDVDDGPEQETTQPELGTDVDKPSLSQKQKRNLKKKAQRQRKQMRENQTEGASNENKTGTSTGGSGVQTRSATRKLRPTERQIIIHFHVLVSEDFKFDPEKDKVILKSGTLDGWESDARIMKLVRPVSNNRYEMEYEMKLPASRLQSSVIVYKYMVKKHDKDKVHWEHYQKDGSYGEHCNRTMYLLHQYKTADVWHQYDGFLEKNSKSFKDRAKEKITGAFGWKKDPPEHMAMAMEIFCQSMFQLDGPDCSMVDNLCLPEMCVIGFKKMYHYDAKCWSTPALCENELVDLMVSKLLEKVACGENPESSQQTEQRLCIAFAVLKLLKTFSTDISEKNRRILSKALRLTPPVGNVEKEGCLELQIVYKMFPDPSKQLLEQFIWVGEIIARSSKDPSWLYLMPWVHFLSGLCHPYDKPQFDMTHENTRPVWWGTAAISEGVHYFKGKTQPWSIPMEVVLNELYPVFEMDFYLARSFVAALNLKELNTVIQCEKIPLEISLAAVFYYLRKTRPNYISTSYGKSFPSNPSEGESAVQVCIISVLKQVQEKFYREEECTCIQWNMIHQIAAQVLDQSVMTNRWDTLGYCTQIFIHCLALYDRILSEDKEDKVSGEKPDGHIIRLKACMAAVIRWMGTYAWDVSMSSDMEHVLKVWNSLYAPAQCQSERIRDMWNKGIAEEMQKRLDRSVCSARHIMANFVEVYCKKVEDFNGSMTECLSKVAFKAIAEGYSLNYGTFNDAANRRFGRLLSDLFISEWEKTFKTQNVPDDEMILIHVLQWPPFLQFLKIFNTDQSTFKLLSEDCMSHLVLAVSVIVNRAESLFNGSIKIKELNMIVAQAEKFSELAVLADAKFVKKDIAAAISWRNQDLESFKGLAQQIKMFINLCQHSNGVDTKSVVEVLDKQKDFEQYQVREFCMPVAMKDGVYIPQVHAFDVSPAVRKILTDLCACSNSSTFLKIWQNQCKAVECQTLHDVVQNVWVPVKERWDDCSGQITKGVIKFLEFEKLIGRMFKKDLDAMKVELRSMKVPESAINQRLDQLTKYRQLEACVKGAKVVLKFVKEYSLTGNFDPIRDIANYGQKDFPMKSFDESLMQTCAFLKELTPKRAGCLNTFVQCEPLIQWLKTSMKKSGLKELKVFVDLAFMSAGDDTMNIARVQCLHSAVTGYAQLIFDLQETADYKQLLQICRVVWKELEANPDLPKKLKDTTHHLEWLKEIEKAHGSVEVTSLVQSDAINSGGVYTVGRGARKQTQDKTPLGIDSDPSESVRLTVSEAEEQGKRQRRNYTFTQLQDLQSRLMLVAGQAEKGNDGVEMFTMIYDSVKRLANVYMRLCCSGCVLFRDWTATFFCDPSCPACTILDFGQGVTPLKGRRNKMEDLREMIPRLASFMEDCHEEWLKYIRRKRQEFLDLNYFTVDQLVILQREIVKLKPDSEDQPSHLIYPLLSAVKANCSTEDLQEAMTAAQAEMDREQMEVAGEGEDGEGDDMDQAEDERMAKQELVQELVGAGYERRLAQRAIDHVGVGPDAVSEGIHWCMVHEGDDEEEEATLNEVPGRVDREEPAFRGWSQSAPSMLSMISSNVRDLHVSQSDNGVEPLLNELRELWEKFLGSISSKVQDYLSLEHLGIILGHLAQKDRRRIERGLPPGFKEGSPNLIICPSGDVLTTALSIYMLERDQPFPQPDEVLMCTAHTTIDEVDIFWRRAIFDGGRKIHCLLDADRLDFNVSEMAERCLEEYIQETNHAEPKYRLIVICGMDNEYRSRIVASLDKHRRPGLPINHQGLRNYIATKLQITNTLHGLNPAPFVDYQRSSVRLVKSTRAGVGKTLYKQRREQALREMSGDEMNCVSLPLQEKHIDLHYFIQRLLEHTAPQNQPRARIFHIDIAHEVEEGVDYLLFNLLVLGCLMDRSGYVWRKLPTDLYLIETMPLMMAAQRGGEVHYVHPMLSILPDMICRSPQESLGVYRNSPPIGYMAGDQLFDKDQFESPVFQRPFQYLHRLDQGRKLDDIEPYKPEGDPGGCLQTLLRHCGVQDPSWAELHHFVGFLNTQLQGFEQNSFTSVAAAEDLPGFGKFVLRFLIQMSRDFSTRSLNMSEESPGVPRTVDEEDENDAGNVLQQYKMRRTWESSPHPYLFFNQDKFTFTFLGFYIDRDTGNLIDQTPRPGQPVVVLERAIMTQNLYDSLVRNHAPMKENFDKLPRDEKIRKLCSVMGNELPYDPDDSYELTTDNVKKMMAIYMRFRCDIPVIIMGETGCGKTRLVKFMCALQIPPGLAVTNMILMKVHGGTTNADIKRKVEEAERAAQQNIQAYGEQMYTVLFFDEANTTEAIGLIKEIMCDKSMEGRKLKLCKNLKMVAACNPYRKHSDELIKKLEQAGLGYHVDADETTDKLGRVPMRRLVYRVQPLPQSLLPLVWDFGQLNTNVEDLYIRQMVRRYVRADELPDIQGLVEVVSAILTASQFYMREQRDECSFVSLRDVDRVLRVMSWFYDQSEGQRTLYNLMDKKLYNHVEEREDEEDDDEETEMQQSEEYLQEGQLDDVTRSLVLALGICYHACLKDRPQYRTYIARHFQAPCRLFDGANQIEREISCCQEVFLDNVQLEKNIARNMALKENIFMMVVCIELRLPLFLVGKPGSSKSLAKTIVSDAMQGNASREILFKELKQAQMVSFQCSPLSTPDGIVGTFRQCAQFQKDKDLNNFVSIVVLDEVGLAEDSPRMPLKTLHPLLEDGCQGDEKPEAYMKVAFVGISNWALDPAKMNRGILVQREVPDLTELENSAMGICDTSHELVKDRMQPLISPMAASYLEIFKKASTSMREFFGLRDFYSLVKMVYSFSEKSRQEPTWYEMVHAIKRNFGGLDQVDPVKFFRKHLASSIQLDEQRRRGDPDCTAAGLIQACLFNKESESRYLLLLTENYGALTILQQQILSSDIRPITIFGSSFRSDQEYTQVCRNINKIKVCMETGNTVVLLNLENLYESLYDALNQYYVYFGGERYVDLGLGTHRVKCPVHKNFRLIVVAEKQTVYKKFPIPLINRLEKHFLTINTMLSPEQLRLVKRLEDWARQFVSQTGHRGHSSKAGDAFMGYHDDTCSAIILHVWPKPGQEDVDQEQLLQEAKAILLWCATPAAVVRVEQSALPPQEKTTFQNQYLERQRHGSIAEYLHFKLVEEGCKQLYAQVTTHSKLLVAGHRRELAQATGISHDKIMLLDTLSSFDTEQQFSNKIQQHMKRDFPSPSLLVIQCDSGDTNANLVACARYCVMDEYLKVSAERRASIHIVFIVQLPNIAGGCFTGFQCGIWHSAHIDDLWTIDVDLPSIQEMQTKSVSRLVSDAVQTAVPMETEEGNAGVEREEMEWVGEEMQEERPAALGGSMYGEEPIPLDGAAAMHQPHRADVENQSLEDMIQMAGMPLDRHPDAGSRRHLNVQKLILSCVQAALSMLKDKEESSVRTTDRVALLLKLFHQDSTIGKRFLQGVSQLIASLLEEKEGTSYRPKQWLLNEAARIESIQKAGTFRQACIQTLESKISPILAGIIAHLDTNQNLDILQQQQLPWKQDVWLAILNTAGTLQLQYSDLQSPKRQSDLKEVVVRTTGCEGHVFKGQMPFSWLIYQQISNVIKNPQPGHEEERSITDTVEFFVTVLVETPLGKLLWEMRDHTIVEDILQAYLGDLVHFVYLVQSDQEHVLVCQTIEYKASLEPTEGTLLHQLVMFHIAHHALAPRLTYFRAMNSVWPECSNTIVNLKRENPDHYMFKEEEFTFSVLCELIKYLSPKDLDRPQGRTAWLAQVHQMRPVIEKVLNLYVEDPQRYGAHSTHSVQEARYLWTRVVVMKLFLEHVCATEGNDNITIKYCKPLWGVLTDTANMKEVATFSNVEKFLKNCNRMAINQFLGKRDTCILCEMMLEGAPIVLPCKEVLCDRCFQDILAAQGDRRCPKCRVQVPRDWNPERQAVKQDERKKLKDYQKRCNSFFMDLVSQLCFADNTPPSQEVVDQLFGYITCSTKNAQRLTKEISVFETGVDPNPVFRSFLLQLLMRTCEEHVGVNLGKYLDHANHFFNRDPGMQKEFTQLCLLVIQCLEDIYNQQATKPDIDKLSFATRCLQDGARTLNVDQINVDKLTGLAEIRTGLAIVARCLFDVSRGKVVDTKVRHLLQAAQGLCQDGGSKWPRNYVVKVLCRRYGTGLYHRVCQSDAHYLRWINMRDRQAEQQVEGADQYIVCGDIYTRIREAVAKVVLGEDTRLLDQAIQAVHYPAGHTDVFIRLAIHREITCSNLYPPRQRRVNENVLTVMDKYVQTSKIVKNKELAQALIHNAIGRRCTGLQIRPNVDLFHQGVQSLLIHLLCAISHLQGDRTLIHPLIMFMRSPQDLANSYLPTMPQDDIEDVKQALLDARNRIRGADANPVFYRCPNGHPYVIGDCGRPYVVAKCKCGADIGGQGHQPLPNNVQDTGVDTTQTGHILGRAEGRVQGPYTERAMTPTYFAILRLLMHMAMYLGADYNPQATAVLIKPAIRAEDVPEFLWQHIHRDIEDVRRAIGRSVDDVLVLVHLVINRTMRMHKPASSLPTEVHLLTSKKGRSDWEKKFTETYLVPIVQKMDKELKTVNQQLAQDNRLGADPLLSLLYEVDGQGEEAAVGPLQDAPEVWRYRTPVSLTHLRQEFEAQVAGQKGKPKYTVLQQFLKEDHHLRAIRHIPSILRLHRALFFKYQRKLDKAEASNITVGHLKREEIAGEETRTLVEDFSEAWELVREDLKLYLCPTEVGGMIVPKEYCSQPITDRTPISLLLPTTKEAGLCSLAMLDFLMRKQNGFLDSYQKVTKRKLDSVPAREVTSAHLISYDPQHDILPLVLANCQYSFEMGKGTKIEYDFAGLERQLMDRFMFSKSRIDVGRVIQIDQMIYRTEFTNAVVFKCLAEKIPQVGLNSAVKSQILAEIRSLPELCQSLDNLDISISFLKSIGGQPQHSLADFMVNTLRMDVSLCSQKAKQICQFQHTQSLWMLLSLQKSKQLAEHKQAIQSIFESVTGEFMEDLPDDVMAEFVAYMRQLSVEKLTQLVEVLHEYIILVVAVRENRDDEDYMDTTNQKLREWLCVYVDSQDQPGIDTQVLAEIPATILYKHSVNTWVMAYRMLLEKQTGQRRF